MPMFVKMGLGGTGYLGHKESDLRSKRKRAARRSIKQGFPIIEKFTSIEDVREYLSGDRVICLLCGKTYKDVGKHLRVHDISPDQYREMYNIPWTYPLCCHETSEAFSEAVRKRIEDGKMEHLFEVDTLRMKKMREAQKREEFFKSEIAQQNMDCSPRRPLLETEDGTLETFTERRERLTTKRGSDEFIQKMKDRPQCKREDFFLWWKGKKQSSEHVRKRISATMATKKNQDK